jgi:two-component system, LytTR family, sensor kinase
MRVTLQHFRGKDLLIFKSILLPYSLCLNFVIFGMQYVSSLVYFLTVSAITIVAFTIFYTLCGGVAVSMKRRFSGENQTVIQLGIIIVTGLLMSALLLFLLFRFYKSIPYFGFVGNEEIFMWSFLVLGIGQIFLAFVHEGAARHEVWKQNRQETEQLRAVYQRSRLEGLRSQVNPHFLFNSLNSLSSLISEEGDEAELFLDEMTKVYRYMLRNETDTLVSLGEELRFLQSYNYLLQARYGTGLQIQLAIDDSVKSQKIAPLTFQTIIENAFTFNSVSKSNPLVISIKNIGKKLVFTHNLQQKTITEELGGESALDNLISKYNLLSIEGATVTETSTERIIQIPLLTDENQVAL